MMNLWRMQSQSQECEPWRCFGAASKLRPLPANYLVQGPPAPARVCPVQAVPPAPGCRSRSARDNPNPAIDLPIAHRAAVFHKGTMRAALASNESGTRIRKMQKFLTSTPLQPSRNFIVLKNAARMTEIVGTSSLRGPRRYVNWFISRIPRAGLMYHCAFCSGLTRFIASHISHLTPISYA